MAESNLGEERVYLAYTSTLRETRAGDQGMDPEAGADAEPERFQLGCLCSPVTEEKGSWFS